MVRSRSLLVTAVATLLLLTGACSSDGDGDSKGSSPGGSVASETPSDPALVPYAEAITASILEDDDDSGLDLSGAQATCLGNSFANTIGLAQFEKANVTPEMIREGEEFGEGLGVDERETAEALYDDMRGCGIDIRSLLLDEMAKESTPDAMSCFEDVITEDMAKELMMAAFMEEEPADSVYAPLVGCALQGMDDLGEDFDS